MSLFIDVDEEQGIFYVKDSYTGEIQAEYTNYFTCLEHIAEAEAENKGQ